MKNQFLSVVNDKKSTIFNAKNVNSITVTQKIMLVEFENKTNLNIPIENEGKPIDIKATNDLLMSYLNEEKQQETLQESLINKYLEIERGEVEKHLLNSKEEVKKYTLEELEALSEKNHNMIEYKLNNGLIYFLEGIEIRDLLSEINTRKAFPREDII